MTEPQFIHRYDQFLALCREQLGSQGEEYAAEILQTIKNGHRLITNAILQDDREPHRDAMLLVYKLAQLGWMLCVEKEIEGQP